MITQIDVSNGEDQTILSLKVNGEMILFVPKSDYDELQSRVKELSEENESLREALELIKNKAPWCDCMDTAKIADEALTAGEDSEQEGRK